MIITVSKLEEEQRILEEQERQRQHENALAIEQLRNRALQLDLQRRRDRREAMQPTQPPHPLFHPHHLQPDVPHEQSQQNGKYRNF